MTKAIPCQMQLLWTILAQFRDAFQASRSMWCPCSDIPQHAPFGSKKVCMSGFFFLMPLLVGSSPVELVLPWGFSFSALSSASSLSIVSGDDESMKVRTATKRVTTRIHLFAAFRVLNRAMMVMPSYPTTYAHIISAYPWKVRVSFFLRECTGQQALGRLQFFHQVAPKRSLLIDTIAAMTYNHWVS